MSRRPAGPRRASVQVRAESVASLPTVAGKALHQYWSLLAPHFRGILLAPLWRTDGQGLTWSWSEPATPSSLSAAELATVRKRLAAAQRSITAAAEDAPPETSRRGGVNMVELATGSASVVNALAGLTDTALAPFVVRCEQGLMIHSWGLATALVPFDPDKLDRAIGGTVFVAGQPAAAATVHLSAPSGPPLSQTHTDAGGRVQF
jgi:hypothetical protein